MSTKGIISVQCSRCHKIIQDDDYLQNCRQDKCQFKFHKNCFFKELNDQKTRNEVVFYKCKCGTKIPQKLIWDSGAPNKMDLLSSIYRRQLDWILKLSILRKNKEILEYCNQNKEKEYEQDYFLQVQDDLIYKDTPQ